MNYPGLFTTIKLISAIIDHHGKPWDSNENNFLAYSVGHEIDRVFVIMFVGLWFSMVTNHYGILLTPTP